MQKSQLKVRMRKIVNSSMYIMYSMSCWTADNFLCRIVTSKSECNVHYEASIIKGVVN